MKKLIVLIVLLLTAYFTYSQTTYPQRLKIGNDTLNVFTDKQVSDILKTFISEEYLFKEIEEYKIIVSTYDSLISVNNSMINNYKTLIVNKNNQLVLKDKLISQKEQDIKIEKKKKIKGIIIGIVSGFTLGIITSLII